MSNLLPGTEEKVAYSSSLDVPSTEKSFDNSHDKEQVSSTSTSPPSIIDNKGTDDDTKEESLKSKNEEREVVEDESAYLHGAKLGLVMLGLCMAGLLVGLVRKLPNETNRLLTTSMETLLTSSLGQCNPCYCYPNHHYRFQLPRRRWLVWQCVLNDSVKIPRPLFSCFFTDICIIVAPFNPWLENCSPIST